MFDASVGPPDGWSLRHVGLALSILGIAAWAVGHWRFRSPAFDSLLALVVLLSMVGVLGGTLVAPPAEGVALLRACTRVGLATATTLVGYAVVTGIDAGTLSVPLSDPAWLVLVVTLEVVAFVGVLASVVTLPRLVWHRLGPGAGETVTDRPGREESD